MKLWEKIRKLLKPYICCEEYGEIDRLNRLLKIEQNRRILAEHDLITKLEQKELYIQQLEKEIQVLKDIREKLAKELEKKRRRKRKKREKK